MQGVCVRNNMVANEDLFSLAKAYLCHLQGKLAALEFILLTLYQYRLAPTSTLGPQKPLRKKQNSRRSTEGKETTCAFNAHDDSDATKYTE